MIGHLSCLKKDKIQKKKRKKKKKMNAGKAVREKHD